MFSCACAKVQTSINAAESLPVDVAESFLWAANELALNCDTRVSGSSSIGYAIYGAEAHLKRFSYMKQVVYSWRVIVLVNAEHAAALSTLVMLETSYIRTRRHAQRFP